MVSEVAHGLEDLAEPLVVADVVTDEVGVSHGTSGRVGSPPDRDWFAVRGGRRLGVRRS
jgi:hypothetical protein